MTSRKKNKIKKKKVDEICVIKETKGKWVCIEARVDSCAADNVVPIKMFPDIKLEETEASRSGRSYAAANGG